MPAIDHVRALIDQAKSDHGAVRELEELQCLMLAWLSEQNRGDRAAGPRDEPALAVLVRFDRHESQILDLLAGAAGVPSRAVAQRLVAHALFHPEMREAAVQGEP
ncbi:hypothetical protein P7D22_11590 [Lichenihabitans sp. Uapishka_5]|uniref:hypothetical protein n=1 Tax=Lichenihabitans sp. Uapishka_5 TaxID=3037302 RepID=UPI0029E815BC|nr:hypothetical protein [Lichenihabitans sp. Uapishka_5]MDX7951812.1 hypothetical protein [Lichenihabitans sp. Uapishka_5]